MHHVAESRSFIGLEELMVRDGHGPGFYIACGSRDLTSAMLDVVVKILPQHAFPDFRLFWVDSGNSFDAYRVAAQARERGLNPTPLLRAIKIARPFTAFQFHEILAKIPGEREGQTYGGWPPLVIISDLMGLFYDSEIQELDVERAFRQFVARLAQLKSRAIVLALLIDHQVPFHRRHFLPKVLPLARRVVSPPAPAHSLGKGRRLVFYRSFRNGFPRTHRLKRGLAWMSPVLRLGRVFRRVFRFRWRTPGRLVWPPVSRPYPTSARALVCPGHSV